MSCYFPCLQELPPVEFDWDNSGLTNPLTGRPTFSHSHEDSVLATSGMHS